MTWGKLKNLLKLCKGMKDTQLYDISSTTAILKNIKLNN